MELMVSPRERATIPKAAAPSRATATQINVDANRDVMSFLRLGVFSTGTPPVNQRSRVPTFRYNLNSVRTEFVLKSAPTRRFRDFSSSIDAQECQPQTKQSCQPSRTDHGSIAMAQALITKPSKVDGAVGNRSFHGLLMNGVNVRPVVSIAVTHAVLEQIDLAVAGVRRRVTAKSFLRIPLTTFATHFPQRPELDPQSLANAFIWLASPSLDAAQRASQLGVYSFNRSVAKGTKKRVL